MGTIKYKSEEGRTLECKEKEWYYETKGKMKIIPRAAFYQIGKNEELKDYKAGRSTPINFLLKGENPEEALCPGHLYFIVKGIMKRTSTLTRIADES